MKWGLLGSCATLPTLVEEERGELDSEDPLSELASKLDALQSGVILLPEIGLALLKVLVFLALTSFLSLQDFVWPVGLVSNPYCPLLKASTHTSINPSGFSSDSYCVRISILLPVIAYFLPSNSTWGTELELFTGFPETLGPIPIFSWTSLPFPLSSWTKLLFPDLSPD